MEYNKLLPNIRQSIEIGMILAKRLLENLHRDEAPRYEFERDTDHSSILCESLPQPQQIRSK